MSGSYAADLQRALEGLAGPSERLQMLDRLPGTTAEMDRRLHAATQGWSRVGRPSPTQYGTVASDMLMQGHDPGLLAALVGYPNTTPARFPLSNELWPSPMIKALQEQLYQSPRNLGPDNTAEMYHGMYNR